MGETREEPTTPIESNTHKKVILEIGPGINPHFKNRTDLDSNAISIGIDDRMGAVFTNFILRDLNAKGSGIVGNARSLPFSNSSCDEVVLVNVFGISGVALRKHGYLIDYPDSDSIISEIKRVIKENGSCVVLETLTPPDKEKILTKFKVHGLELLLDSSDPQILNNYSDPRNRPSDTTPYLLKFKLAYPSQTLNRV